MHFVVRAAVVAALLTSAGSFDQGLVAPPPVVTPPRKSLDAFGLAGPCGKRTLPEGEVCIPLAAGAPAPATSAEPFAPRAGAERHEAIAKLPDRPADFGAYVLPWGAEGKAPAVLDARLRKASEREGVELATERGDRIRAVALDHQDGNEARVIFVGELFGPTVITLHAVKDGDRERSIALVMGELELAEPGLEAGAHVAEGAPLGYAATGRLHLEAREVRAGVDVTKIDPKKLVELGVATPTDPRNVLRPR